MNLQLNEEILSFSSHTLTQEAGFSLTGSAHFHTVTTSLHGLDLEAGTRPGPGPGPVIALLSAPSGLTVLCLIGVRGDIATCWIEGVFETLFHPFLPFNFPFDQMVQPILDHYISIAQFVFLGENMKDTNSFFFFFFF